MFTTVEVTEQPTSVKLKFDNETGKLEMYHGIDASVILTEKQAVKLANEILNYYYAV